MKFAQLTCLDALDPLTKLGPKVVPVKRQPLDHEALARRDFENRCFDVGMGTLKACITTVAVPAPVPKTEVPQPPVKQEVPAAPPVQSEVPVTRQDYLAKLRAIKLERKIPVEDCRKMLRHQVFQTIPFHELPAILQAFERWEPKQ